jgi:hypothetical protein
MRRTRRAEAGLTEEVGRRWDGEKRPVQWHSDGGRLRWGGGVLVGGPVARGGGEGGNCGRGVRAEEQTQRGEKNPTGDAWSKAGEREKGRAAGIGPQRAGADARD